MFINYIYKGIETFFLVLNIKSTKIESEKYLEDKLIEKIKLKKGLCIKLLSNHFTGLPDRLCLLPGAIIFFCEVKTTGFKPSGRQRLVCKQLSRLGFNVYLINSSEIINKLTGDDVRL